MELDNLLSEGDLNVTAARRSFAAEHLDDNTRALIEEDSRYFLHQSLSTPVMNVMKSAAGSGFTDWQDRKYYDFHGNWVHLVGFGHPAVKAAIIQQMDALPFCTRRYTNLPAIQLARKLHELAPGDLNRVLFAPGGALAIGMALKIARMATGRFKTVSMWDAFHGASMDAISVGGEAIFRRDLGPLLPGTEHVPPPNPASCPFKCGRCCSTQCADYLEYVLDKEGDVGAVVAETIRSTPYIPPKDYWKKIRAACDRHGALLILDEIPNGMGRTGKMFTFEHYDIIPDLVVVGKAFGGGMLPLAAVIAREHLNDAIKDRAIGHYTHEKNPVVAAASLAMIEVIEKEQLLQAAVTKGQHAINRLERLKSQLPAIWEIRGLGLLMGIELRNEAGTPLVRESEMVMYEALKRGLNFKVSMGNVLTLMPALTISIAELDEALDILADALTAVFINQNNND